MSTRERTQRWGWWLDLAFLLGLGFKAVDGLVEVLAAAVLLLVPAQGISNLAHAVTAGELREDPGSNWAHALLTVAARLDPTTGALTGLYLLDHGAVKLAIFIAVLRGTRRVYPWAIAALAAFTVYQVVLFILQPGLGLGLLMLVDALVLALTWREWRHHRGLGEVWRSVTHRFRRAA